MNRIIKTLLLSALLLSSSSVCALGLGKITVESALGQPLQARVELTGTQEEFAAVTRAGIASPQSYAARNLTYVRAFTRTKVELHQSSKGRAYLSIKSKDDIKVPYLDLLVELSWPDGQAVREYTFLLDLPKYQ